MSGRGLDDRSMDGFSIRGWLLAPTGGAPTRGFIVGHGYGGVDEPRFALPDRDAAYLIPCFRGLGRSPRPPIPDNPAWHLLQDIHLNNLYISGDCMEDLWFGVSAFIALHSQIAGRLDYLGSRFDRGIRALGLPGEPRLSRGRLNVPSFSHQPLRLRLSTLGAEGVKKPQIRQKATEFVHQK